MSYTKTKWVNKGEVNEDGVCPALDADNLNKIEDGIETLDINKVEKNDYNTAISERPPISEISTLGMFKGCIAEGIVDVTPNLRQVYNNKLYYMVKNTSDSLYYIHIFDLSTGEKSVFNEYGIPNYDSGNMCFFVYSEEIIYVFYRSYKLDTSIYNNTTIYNFYINMVTIRKDVEVNQTYCVYAVQGGYGSTSSAPNLVEAAYIYNDNIFIKLSSYYPEGAHDSKSISNTLYTFSLKDLSLDNDLSATYISRVYYQENIFQRTYSPIVIQNSNICVGRTIFKNCLNSGDYTDRIETKGVVAGGNNELLILDNNLFPLWNAETNLPEYAATAINFNPQNSFLYENYLYTNINGYLFKTRLI